MYHEYSIHWEVELYKHCKTWPIDQVFYAQLCYWREPGSTQSVSVRFNRSGANCQLDTQVFCVVLWAWASSVSTIGLVPISPNCQVNAHIVLVV